MDGFAYVVCDVFTDRPLTGNQLAVFTGAAALPESSLQSLAREMNFSETVFVYPPAADGDASLRIFTPTAEIPFAGHPTLGTAVVLATPDRRSEIRLETGVGTIPIVLRFETDRPAFGRMRQPVPKVTPVEDALASALLAALGVDRSLLPVERYDNGLPHVYVVLADPEPVARLQPDFGALARLARGSSTPLVGFNCLAGSGHRWKTRMFAPADGVPEDPATGSAAGPLACHLARHGLIPFGEEIEISQGAEIDRPSTLYARASGSQDAITSVEVGGHAVIVARGAFAPAAVAQVGGHVGSGRRVVV